MLFFAVVLCAGGYVAGRLQSRTLIEAPPAAWAEDHESAKAWQALLVAVESAASEIAERVSKAE